jgi:hypothetical protein
VAIAAGVVEATRRLSPGGVIAYDDFPPAFFTVSAITAASALIFLRLPTDAGAGLAGRQGSAQDDEKSAEKA